MNVSLEVLQEILKHGKITSIEPEWCVEVVDLIPVAIVLCPFDPNLTFAGVKGYAPQKVFSLIDGRYIAEVIG